MTVAPAAPGLLTFDEYMTEGTVWERYDIVGGGRVFMSAPTYRHQRVQMHTLRILQGFEERSGLGVVVSAPFDVLIRRVPRLQTRQPDVLFVTHATLARGGGIPDNGPLTVGPEVVVEVISSSDRAGVLGDKLADYASIGVQEAWVVRPDTNTVEVIHPAPGGPVTVATYGRDDTLTSVVLPTLSAPVADLFRP